MTDLAHEIMLRCDALAKHSEDENQLTRTYLSAPFKAVHKEVKSWMKQAGMTVRIDNVGNIIGHYEGQQKDAPVFMIGSHLDTVRNAGKYDGMLGVLLGIAVVKALNGKKLPFGIAVIGFSEEEGVRFGATYFGSQGVTGSFNKAQLELKDADGISMYDAIKHFGLNPDKIASCIYPKKDLLGYLEVHIEQGPVLASLDKAIGIAEAIVGQSKLELNFVGKAGHAGTSPMHLRQDALVAAAAFVVAVESYAKQTEGLVATVGKLEAKPGASNVIAGEASLSLDIRHKDESVRADAVTALLSKAHVIAADRELKLYHKTLLDAETAWMSKTYTNLLLKNANAPRMVSGAGHDAAIMSHYTQSALMFVRSPNGISHNPLETVLEEDVNQALNAVGKFLEQLELAYV